jgi:hypothetical protein
VLVDQVPTMSLIEVCVCQCPRCQAREAHPDRVLHEQMNLLLSRLGEAERRWYAAVEANRRGRGGAQVVAQITGLDEKTIRRGQQEVAGSLVEVPVKRQRRPGGGRPPVEKKIRPS